MYKSIINYQQLFDAVKRIQAIHVKTKKKQKDYLLELSFKPNQLEVNAIGISLKVECKSSFYIKLIVPFLSLRQLIDSLNLDQIELEFDNKYIELGNRRIESAFIKVEHPENHRNLKLVMNYSKLELLSLRDQYSENELETNNLLLKLKKAEIELEDNLTLAASALKDYGFTYSILHQLIDKKIEAIRNLNMN